MNKIVLATLAAAVLSVPAMAQQPNTNPGQNQLQSQTQTQPQNQRRVGRLAQQERLENGQIDISVRNLAPNQITDIQRALNQKGMHVGRVNGMWRREDRIALQKFQREHDLTATGQLDRRTVMALGLSPSAFGIYGGQPVTTGQAPRRRPQQQNLGSGTQPNVNGSPSNGGQNFEH
jgi:murein L,D-transpeptidase YcbB/YkuD